jgi:hypothetical protein
MKALALSRRQAGTCYRDGMDAPCTGIECAKMERLLTPQQGTPMSEITVIGLDLAKHVFQVHGATVTVGRYCASGFGAARCWSSLPVCHRV